LAAQSPPGRLAPHQNNAFLKPDNHFAFQQVIDPTQIGISEQQKLRYARALRILGLQPHFHISELDALLTPDNKDAAFWTICHRQVDDCPKISNKPARVKRKLFREYLRTMTQGLL
jgi:hypothetical protein